MSKPSKTAAPKPTAEQIATWTKKYGRARRGQYTEIETAGEAYAIERAADRAHETH